MNEPRALPRQWWLAIIGLLLLLPVAFFWPLWWPGMDQRLAFLPGDFTDQQYAWRVFVAGEWRAGRLPLWDPYSFAGRPALPDTQLAAFYPLTLWQALFPPPLPLLAVELSAVAHLGLGALFSFGFVRRLTGRVEAGLCTAVAFGLGGYLTAYPMLQTAILQSAIWLPLGLWLSESALTQRSWPGLAWAGAAIGLSLLGGHPQTTMYAAYALGAYIVFRALTLRVGWQFLARALFVWGLTALGLSAVQWWPSLELAQVSPRAHVPYDQVSVGFQFFELLGLLRPNLVVWSPLYIGAAPLALAAVGVVLRARQAETLFWLAAFGVAVIFSLGGNTPVFPFIYDYVPGFRVFRAQEHAAFIISFTLAVLAGLGCAAVLQRVRVPRWAIVLGLALTFFDLYRASAGLNLTAPPAGGYFASTPASDFIAQAAAGQIWRVSGEALLPGGGNAGLYYNIREVTGNSPLYPSSRDAFHEMLPEVRWWQLLNVRYLLTRRAIDFPGLTLVLDDPARDQRLYELQLGGQAAWIAHQFEVAPDQESAFALAADMNWEPTDRAVLENAPDPAPAPAVGAERADVTRFEHQRVVVRAALSAPGILVISEPEYPGWAVRVNGQRATPLRAFGMLRAVALPAGEWEVEWRFESFSAYAGLTVTLLTVTVLIGLALWRHVRASHRPASPA
jgi:hypothetical protein